MVFIDAERDPTLDKALSNFETRLLYFLISRMNEKNEVRLSQGEIARALGKHPPDISKAIKTLRAREYVSTPQQGVVAISPDVAWRAALDDNQEALESWRA